VVVLFSSLSSFHCLYKVFALLIWLFSIYPQVSYVGEEHSVVSPAVRVVSYGGSTVKLLRIQFGPYRLNTEQAC
jgi:hypothetical protein